MSGCQVLEPSGTTKGGTRNADGTIRRFHLRWALFLFLGTATFSIIYGGPLILERSRRMVALNVMKEGLQRCAANFPPIAVPPAEINPWASLSVEEIVEITQWLEAPSREYNLTSGDTAGLADNMIFLVEAYRPTKASALLYLSSPVQRNLPDRYARVTIHHGATHDPYIMDYLVGPLPVSNATSIRPLTEIYHREKITFNSRGYTAQVGVELLPFLSEVMAPLVNATKVRPTDIKMFWLTCANRTCSVTVLLSRPRMDR